MTMAPKSSKTLTSLLTLTLGKCYAFGEGRLGKYGNIGAQAVILTYSTGLSPLVLQDLRGSGTKVDLFYPGQDLRTGSENTI